MAEASDSEMGSPKNEATNSAAQNPSSSDSDSDSDAGEAEELLRLQTLESEVSSDPSKYDAHVEVHSTPYHLFFSLFITFSSLMVAFSISLIDST